MALGSVTAERPCSKCGTCPRRRGQRWCATCHRDYKRGKRATTSEETAAPETSPSSLRQATPARDAPEAPHGATANGGKGGSAVPHAIGAQTGPEARTAATEAAALAETPPEPPTAAASAEAFLDALLHTVRTHPRPVTREALAATLGLPRALVTAGVDMLLQRGVLVDERR